MHLLAHRYQTDLSFKSFNERAEAELSLAAESAVALFWSRFLELRNGLASPDQALDDCLASLLGKRFRAVGSGEPLEIVGSGRADWNDLDQQLTNSERFILSGKEEGTKHYRRVSLEELSRLRLPLQFAGRGYLEDFPDYIPVVDRRPDIILGSLTGYMALYDIFGEKKVLSIESKLDLLKRRLLLEAGEPLPEQFRAETDDCVQRRWARIDRYWSGTFDFHGRLVEWTLPLNDYVDLLGELNVLRNGEQLFRIRIVGWGAPVRLKAELPWNPDFYGYYSAREDIDLLLPPLIETLVERLHGSDNLGEPESTASRHIWSPLHRAKEVWHEPWVWDREWVVVLDPALEYRSCSLSSLAEGRENLAFSFRRPQTLRQDLPYQRRAWVLQLPPNPPMALLTERYFLAA